MNPLRLCHALQRGKGGAFGRQNVSMARAILSHCDTCTSELPMRGQGLGLGLTTNRPSNLAIVASGALATDDLTDGREHRPTDRGGVNPWFLRSHITGDT